MTIALTRTDVKKRELSGEGLRVFVGLMPYVALLLGFIFLRVHNIEGRIPYFVDELRHIARARIVYDFTDLQISTAPGKFLLYYWLGLFGIPYNEPGWLGRTPVALFSMIGASGMVALARLLFSQRVALWSMVIILMFPFMAFYERLALSDPMAASITAVVAWRSVIFARQPTSRNAILLGIGINLMLMAKILAGPMLILPFLALVFYHKDRPQHFERHTVQQVKTLILKNWKPIVIVLLIVAIAWIIIMGIYFTRSVVTPDDTDSIVDGYLYGGLRRSVTLYERPDALKQWRENGERFLDVLYYLWHPAVVIGFLFSLPLVWTRFPRATAYLLLPTLLFWLVVFIVAGELSTRYVVLPGHLIVILLAAGLTTLTDYLPSRVRTYAPAAIVGLWIGLITLPFYMTLIDKPHNLPLPERDRYEYFANQTGYGLRDGLLTVAQMPPISDGYDVPVVYGMVRNCAFLPIHVPADIPLRIECADYSNWTRRDLPVRERRYGDLEARVASYDEIYMLMENFETQPIIYFKYLDAHVTYIKTFPRPHDGVPVSLYRVSKWGGRAGGIQRSPD